ncbi:MAG: radical SAM protein, partial [Ruminococcaceae bacterium]|nr:radical SAM protein [Oscillospiraceae bacterium]
MNENRIYSASTAANNGVQRLTEILAKMDSKPKCYIRTFGCQQNVSDSERMAGMLESCGYEVTEDSKEAELIVFNTCAVREHAEFRVFGNIGAMKKQKEDNPKLIIAVGGCMVQQAHVAEKLKKSYPYVDIIFNTNEIERLCEHLANRLGEHKKSIVAYSCRDFTLNENLPVKRDRSFRAYVPIMYGCDNFCTYCVVPFVRGRERSRRSEDIINEFRAVVAAGYKDIMLLGQNVNS